jgi:hypothetical protein
MKKKVIFRRTTLFMSVAVVFWAANRKFKPLTTRVARMKGRRKRNESLVRKPPRNYHKEERGGYVRTLLGYL